MKVLNLYAGIGGNRKLWENVEVTAVESEQYYEEIIFLQTFYEGNWVIENVIPYYTPLIRPVAELDRHLFWSNRHIGKAKSGRTLPGEISNATREELEALTRYCNAQRHEERP